MGRGRPRKNGGGEILSLAEFHVKTGLKAKRDNGDAMAVEGSSAAITTDTFANLSVTPSQVVSESRVLKEGPLTAGLAERPLEGSQVESKSWVNMVDAECNYADVVRGTTREVRRCLLENRDNGQLLSHVSRRDEANEIDMEDVVDERGYWSCLLVGYVLGNYVPFMVMDRFVTENWRGVAKPQILLHEAGYYVFRFGDREDRAHIMDNS
ncbi:hypothetical protein Droror1_Dr00025287 [Drosera rotundifolia]